MNPKLTPAEIYCRAVVTIALNDEPTDTNLQSVTQQISVCVVAEAFDYSPEKVARAVIRVRRKFSTGLAQRNYD